MSLQSCTPIKETLFQFKDSLPFNRGRLLNVGFVESKDDGPFDCLIFHDIDLLPEDDRHMYHCSVMPRHLGVTSSKYKYRFFYYNYFGGVCSMTEEQFMMVNGWSNRYWGWGMEDDDLRERIEFNELVIWRYPKSIARYTMLSHKEAKRNPNRVKEYFEYKKNFREDGLNSLEYDLISKGRKPLFTSIKVNFTNYFKERH
ncbi:UNVERIFIED_CONTAM: hypothetical protein GTU68_054167 [Idotea baltica]|nr:hypothetical protein [Idotea baltica]